MKIKAENSGKTYDILVNRMKKIAQLHSSSTQAQVSKQCHLPSVFHKKRHPKYEQ